MIIYYVACMTCVHNNYLTLQHLFHSNYLMVDDVISSSDQLEWLAYFGILPFMYTNCTRMMQSACNWRYIHVYTVHVSHLACWYKHLALMQKSRPRPTSLTLTPFKRRWKWKHVGHTESVAKLHTKTRNSSV